MVIKINNPYTINEAKPRIDSIINNASLEFKNEISRLTKQWNGNSVSFHLVAKGFNVSGNLTVNIDLVQIDLKLPWGLTIFKGQIKTAIEEKIKREFI